MTAPKPTVTGVAESMTGFDEIAIQEMFRADLAKMGSTTQMRAMAFLVRRREGMDDGEAFRSVMNAPLSEIDALFGDEELLEGGEGKAHGKTANGRTSSSPRA